MASTRFRETNIPKTLTKKLLGKLVCAADEGHCLHDRDFIEKQYVLGRRLKGAVAASASTNRS